MSEQNPDKPPGCHGKTAFIPVSDGDGAGYGRIGRTQRDPVIGTVQDKLCQNTDSQTRLNHCHDGVIIMDGVFDIWCGMD